MKPRDPSKLRVSMNANSVGNAWSITERWFPRSERRSWHPYWAVLVPVFRADDNNALRVVQVIRLKTQGSHHRDLFWQIHACGDRYVVGMPLRLPPGNIFSRKKDAELAAALATLRRS